MHVCVCLCSYDEIFCRKQKGEHLRVGRIPFGRRWGDLSLRASWLPNKLLQLVMIMLGDAWFIFPSFCFLCDEHMQPGEEEHCACLSSNTASSTPCTMSKELGSIHLKDSTRGIAFCPVFFLPTLIWSRSTMAPLQEWVMSSSLSQGILSPPEAISRHSNLAWGWMLDHLGSTPKSNC